MLQSYAPVTDDVPTHDWIHDWDGHFMTGGLMQVNFAQEGLYMDQRRMVARRSFSKWLVRGPLKWLRNLTRIPLDIRGGRIKEEWFQGDSFLNGWCEGP